MPRPVLNDQYEGDLSPENRDNIIDALAQAIVKKGLVTPAIMFLEMHKPVAFLAGQGMLVASPLLAPLFGLDGVENYSKLFSSAENIELLIRRIEDLADQKAN